MHGIAGTSAVSICYDRMDKTTGTIVLAQESCFKLNDSVGRTRLFILSASAAAEPQDLAALVKRGSVVTVLFETLADQIAGVAHEIAEIQIAHPDTPLHDG